MANVVGLCQTELYVSSLAKGLEFYSDLLGLNVVEEERASDDDSPFARGVVLEMPDGQRLAIRELAHPFVRPAADGFGQYVGFDHICFAVSGLEEIRDRLRENGVVFESSAITQDMMTNGRHMFVRDREGNRVELWESLED